MNAKFLPSEQAAINQVRNTCDQADLNAWFDQSQVKARFKKACMQTQMLRCCYCQKLGASTNNNLWDLEHILCEESYPQFFTVDDNLAIACKACNGAKSSLDVLLPKPTLGHRLLDLPMDSESYAIPHPRIDNWHDYLFHVNYQIYRAEKDKGLTLIQVCKLNEPAIEQAGLSYESVVAATRRDFFDVMGSDVPTTLPDETVLIRMAKLIQSAENNRRDMLLKPLEKKLETLNKKASKILPHQFVEEAKSLARKRKLERKPTKGRSVAIVDAVVASRVGISELQPPMVSSENFDVTNQLLLDHITFPESTECD